MEMNGTILTTFSRCNLLKIQKIFLARAVKKCQGLRGLRSHRRSCRHIRTLDSNDCNTASNDSSSEAHQNGDGECSVDEVENVIAKSPGIKAWILLPRSQKDWDTANSYFHATLPVDHKAIHDLSASVRVFNDTVYSYFASNYGLKKMKS